MPRSWYRTGGCYRFFTDAFVDDGVDVDVVVAAAVKLMPVTLALVTGAGRFAGVKVRPVACGVPFEDERKIKISPGNSPICG
jgi:hypothetical protein